MYINQHMLKGLSIKDVRDQRGGVLSNADIFRTRGEGGSSDADVCTFGAKTSDSLKFLVCPHG